jgi:hypothetical protein
VAGDIKNNKTLLWQSAALALLAGTPWGQNPVEQNYRFTLTQRLDLCNDPTNLQKNQLQLPKTPPWDGHCAAFASKIDEFLK